MQETKSSSIRENRRNFLKKTAIAGAVVGASSLSAAEAKRDIKSSSKKKKEILYSRSEEWGLYYDRSK